jgi:hypothetical protein
MHLQSYLDVNRSQNSIAQAAMAPWQMAKIVWDRPTSSTIEKVAKVGLTLLLSIPFLNHFLLAALYKLDMRRVTAEGSWKRESSEQGTRQASSISGVYFDPTRGERVRVEALRTSGDLVIQESRTAVCPFWTAQTKKETTTVKSIFTEHGKEVLSQALARFPEGFESSIHEMLA